MNKASFLTLVRQASRISDQDVEELEKLVVNFPYCQTAHLLIAKAAYDKGSMLSNQKLKKAAIYAANRQLLKKLIYTSDATVSLQPLENAETVAETTEKVTPAAEKQIVTPTLPEPEILEEVETHEVDLDADITGLENPAIKAPQAEVPQETNPEIPAVAASEAGKEEEVGEKLVAETNAILTQSAEKVPELTVAKALYEDAAIAEDILEEGRLPETEAEFLGELAGAEETLVVAAAFLQVPELASKAEKTEEEKLPEASTENVESAHEKTLSETREKVTTEEIAALETLSETGEKVNAQALSEAETLGETAEKVTETESPAAVFLTPAETPSAETETPLIETETLSEEPISPEEIAAISEETAAETEEIAQEMVAQAAHTLEDVPDLHELFLENAPEAISEPAAAVLETEAVAAGPVTYLNDDLLHETLASFDQYLFRPEKETEQETETAAAEEEELKVVYPKDEIQQIYDQDALGYWMSSSRLGESLQLKNEYTTPQPYDFYPELIWEYSKTHELRKEIKPAVSKLSKQLEIIDEFLKMTPRLKTMAHNKVKPETQEDLSSKSSKIHKSLASENFANILVQQGKIKKAIKIYEHLILKIPEKKPYFVAQIEKLQNQE